MTTVLERILAEKRREVTARSAERGIAALRAAVESAPPARGFARALEKRIASGAAAVIAEIKKASPSRGVIRADFDPPAIARRYEAAGAACLSVLTDTPFFQGRLDDLHAARRAVALPALRKDFMIDPWQILESRCAGADAVLLIVAALDDATLRTLHALAIDVGLDVLVEVHDRDELARALAIDARLIGVNNRDLRTFETRIDTTFALLPHVPAGVRLVTESGIANAEQVAQLRAAGVHAFLVGETFMRADDPGTALAALFPGLPAGECA
jgi:indole-3-glycerol phosphate synthase